MVLASSLQLMEKMSSKVNFLKVLEGQATLNRLKVMDRLTRAIKLKIKNMAMASSFMRMENFTTMENGKRVNQMAMVLVITKMVT